MKPTVQQLCSLGDRVLLRYIETNMQKNDEYTAVYSSIHEYTVDQVHIELSTGSLTLRKLQKQLPALGMRYRPGFC